MAVKTVRTQWSKEPNEEPDYCDWKITLAIAKNRGCGPAPTPTPTRPSTRSSSKTEIMAETPFSSSSSLPPSVTFSVHRNILGPQSEYFNRIFKSNSNSDSSSSPTSVSGFSETRHQHSHINFPFPMSLPFFSIVEAFEALLNYCYLENVDFNGTSPVPLLYLCDYFQMEHDCEIKVEDYSKMRFNELASMKKLHIMYEEIIEYRIAGLNVERAQTITSGICFKEMGLLSKGSPLAKIADLPLWLDIALYFEECGYDIVKNSRVNMKQYKNASKNSSISIANFLENNDNSSAVDANSFQKLTNEVVLPYVDVDAALVLLKEEQKYPTPVVDDISDDDDDKDLEKDLQSRCLESLVEAKLELSINKELRDRATKVMTLLPRRFMGMYLNMTLNSYGEEKVKLEQQVQEQKKIITSKEQALERERNKKKRALDENIQHEAKRRKLEKELESKTKKDTAQVVGRPQAGRVNHYSYEPMIIRNIHQKRGY